MNAYIRPDLQIKLKLLARFRGVTVQDVIEELLELVPDEEQDEIGCYADTED